MDTTLPLCNSRDLVEGGRAVPFDVLFGGQTCRAFAIRFKGQAHAYVNRCTHIPMEMDYQPDQFFDDTGRWLLCATHGAAYSPDTGELIRTETPAECDAILEMYQTGAAPAGPFTRGLYYRTLK